MERGATSVQEASLRLWDVVVDGADLHSELQDEPAHFLDTLVAVASSTWRGILMVVTVSVIDLGDGCVFWEMIMTKIAGPKDQRSSRSPCLRRYHWIFFILPISVGFA